MKYTLEGMIIKGLMYGRKLGFPTANLDAGLSVLQKRIPFGVYAGTATIVKTNETHKAAIVISEDRSNEEPKVEAYLLGFSGDLYGQNVRLDFSMFIREYRHFKTEAELIEQITKDVAEAQTCSPE